MAKRKKLFTILAGLVGLVVVVGVVAQYNKESRAAVQKTPAAVPVNAAQVVVKSMPVRLMAIGNVEPFTTVAIKAERDRGAAPDTVSAEDLSIALNMLSERVMAATFTTEEPAIREDRVIDTLVHIWLASIYEHGYASAGHAVLALRDTATSLAEYPLGAT